MQGASQRSLLIRSAGTRGLIDGLRGLRMPDGVLAILQMTIAHIHLLGRTAHGMVLGRRARVLQPPTLRQAYGAVAAQGVVLLQKSTGASRDVHSAMLARGFTGRFPQASITRNQWGSGDMIAVVVCILAAAGALLS